MLITWWGQTSETEPQFSMMKGRCERPGSDPAQVRAEGICSSFLPEEGREGIPVKERCVGTGGEHGAPRGPTWFSGPQTGWWGDEAGMCLAGLGLKGP